jgi:transcription elongation factor GreA
VNEKPVYLTEEGLENLEAKLDELVNVKRPELAARLNKAIKQGDLSENADYITAKEAQGFLEGQIQEIQHKIRNAVLIEETENGDGRVRLGSHVTVLEMGYDDKETYHVVGPTEADPSKGKISHESPLGKALLGHSVGDEVTIRAPAGEIVFKLLEVV